MSLNEIELKGMTLEIYDSQYNFLADISYVFSLYYNKEHGLIILKPKHGSKKYGRNIMLLSTMLTELLNKDYATGIITIGHRADTLGRYYNNIVDSFNRKRVTCILKNKERFDDEITKADYKYAIGVTE